MFFHKYPSGCLLNISLVSEGSIIPESVSVVLLWSVMWSHCSCKPNCGSMSEFFPLLIAVAKVGCFPHSGPYCHILFQIVLLSYCNIFFFLLHIIMFMLIFSFWEFPSTDYVCVNLLSLTSLPAFWLRWRLYWSLLIILTCHFPSV